VQLGSARAAAQTADLIGACGVGVSGKRDGREMLMMEPKKTVHPCFPIVAPIFSVLIN
jgi:hypothetical protein